MTEDEAKTKWCPQAGSSRFERQDERCLGSSCMAWRALPASGGETVIKAIRRRRLENNAPLYEAKAYVDAHPDYRRRGSSAGGYCGLVGVAA